MRLLVELRLFEAVPGVPVIGHRVLPVLVEEELVEPPGQVVGMLGVAARARPPVDLVDLADGIADRLADRSARRQVVLALGRRVVADEQDEIAYVGRRLDHQPPVHIGLAGADARVLGDVEGRAPVGQPGMNRADRGVWRAVAIDLAIMVGDDELALGDDLAEHLVEKPHSYQRAQKRARASQSHMINRSPRSPSVSQGRRSPPGGAAAACRPSGPRGRARPGRRRGPGAAQSRSRTRATAGARVAAASRSSRPTTSPPAPGAGGRAGRRQPPSRGGEYPPARALRRAFVSWARSGAVGRAQRRSGGPGRGGATPRRRWASQPGGRRAGAGSSPPRGGAEGDGTAPPPAGRHPVSRRPRSAGAGRRGRGRPGPTVRGAAGPPQGAGRLKPGRGSAGAHHKRKEWGQGKRWRR